MKKLLYLLLLFVASSLHAQVQKFWIGDTVRVHCFADINSDMDTVAYVRTSYDNAKSGETIIYWDKAFTHKFIGYKHEPEMFYSGDTTWHSNGQIYRIAAAIGNPANNNLIKKGWFYDGTPEVETTYDSSKMIITYYYHSGKVKQVYTHVKGFLKAWPAHYQLVYFEQRCENGNIIVSDSVISYTPRKITRYYCNGNKQLQNYTMNGYISGKFTLWYENGKTKEEGEYDPADTTRLRQTTGMPRKQGKWSYYDETGKLTKVEWYKDDKMINVEKYSGE